MRDRHRVTFECEVAVRISEDRSQPLQIPAIAETIAQYKEHIADIIEESFAEVLEPPLTDNLAAMMFQLFKAGLVIGLTHAAEPLAQEAILCLAAPEGHA